MLCSLHQEQDASATEPPSTLMASEAKEPQSFSVPNLLLLTYKPGSSAAPTSWLSNMSTLSEMRLPTPVNKGSGPSSF